MRTRYIQNTCKGKYAVNVNIFMPLDTPFNWYKTSVKLLYCVHMTSFNSKKGLTEDIE